MGSLYRRKNNGYISKSSRATKKLSEVGVTSTFYLNAGGFSKVQEMNVIQIGRSSGLDPSMDVVAYMKKIINIQCIVNSSGRTLTTG